MGLVFRAIAIHKAVQRHLIWAGYDRAEADAYAQRAATEVWQQGKKGKY